MILLRNSKQSNDKTQTQNQAVSDENNQDVDLFFVLRTVIDPGDLVPDEGLNEVIYLRDQPVRDVLEKLMNQQMERRAFSNVLHNVSRYVEIVHSHPYSESVLSGEFSMAYLEET
jgi:hypothetical protein